MSSLNYILMIEDSDEDYFATWRALKKSGHELHLTRTINAAEALDFLHARAKFAGDAYAGTPPSLILLDLNLPGIDGRELLVQLKRDERFKQVPVVILTTSNNPRDVTYCYRNGANGYHIKSVGFEKFADSIRQMVSYWFETAIIPSSII